MIFVSARPAIAWLESKITELSFLASAFAICAFCQAADVASSMGATPGSGIVETNSFARHADGSFWLAHGIEYKVIFIVAVILTSVIVFYSLREIHPGVARVAAASPLIYTGIICLWAAVQNVLLLFRVGRF